MVSDLTFQNAERFNAVIARLCAEASQLAYSQYSISENATDTQVLIRESQTMIVVAFRGTASMRNFITDADYWFAATSTPGVTVHGGFNRSIMAIFPALKEAIGKFEPKPLFVTGHSLGGAFAMLFSWRWRAELRAKALHPLQCVYTFGQPRVGNAAFAISYDTDLGDRTWRFVDEEDLVPRMPFWHWGFRHAGNEAFLPSFGGMKLNPGFRFRLLSDCFGLWRAYRRGELAGLLTDGLIDHHIDRYLKRISQLG